jgi:hypothetical protein
LGPTLTGVEPIARPQLPNWNAALPDFKPYHVIGVLPDGAVEGLCPRCLMESALGATSTGAAPISRLVLPNWNAALPDFGPYHSS